MQFTLFGPHVKASFIPFDRMTPREQAEHLVLAHGVGAPYWAHSTGVKPGDLPDDDAVIAWYLNDSFWKQAYHLATVHDGDHDYLTEFEEDADEAHSKHHDHLKGA